MESIRPRKGETITERWPLVLPEFQSVWYGTVNLGNGTAFAIGMFWFLDDGDRRLFMGVEGHGAYPFRGFVHWTYAAKKLGLLEGDAMNIADLLNRQLGHNEGSAQGEYDGALLLK